MFACVWYDWRKRRMSWDGMAEELELNDTPFRYQQDPLKRWEWSLQLVHIAQVLVHLERSWICIPVLKIHLCWYYMAVWAAELQSIFSRISSRTWILREVFREVSHLQRSVSGRDGYHFPDIPTTIDNLGESRAYWACQPASQVIVVNYVGWYGTRIPMERASDNLSPGRLLSLTLLSTVLPKYPR